MKKILLLLALTIVTITATAQIESGLRSGFTLSGSSNSMSEFPGSKSSIGWRLGYALEYNLSEHFYIGSGIVQTVKGSAKTADLSIGMKYWYLQVPLNVGGRIALNRQDTYLFGQVGPYVSYAVSTSRYDVFGYGRIAGEKFDWGLDAKAGVEISDLQIHIGYDLGMANVWKYAVNENVKHRSFFVGITSLF